MANGRFLRQSRKRQSNPPPGGTPIGPSDASSAATSTLTPGGADSLPPDVPAGRSNPRATADLAAGGEPVVRGNSDQAPMTPSGHAQAADMGQALAAQGGPSRIVTSTARRTRETTQDVQGKQSRPVPVQQDPRLESHALGDLEGSPKTPDIRRLITSLIRKHPNARIPGQGATSNRPSESWNEFRVRGISGVKSLMQQLAQNPTEKILVPTSTQVVKLVSAWTAKGHPDDMSIDTDHFLTEHIEQPGAMFRFAPAGPDGHWELHPFDPHTQPFTGGAIYFLLHGETPSSTAPPDRVSATQAARAQIVKSVMTRDWKGAQKAAKDGAGIGLRDDEIDSAIDEALPDANGARDMGSHDLLAAVSAASPNKRRELLPVAKERFNQQAMTGLTPEAYNALRSHFGRIGMS